MLKQCNLLYLHMPDTPIRFLRTATPAEISSIRWLEILRGGFRASSCLLKSRQGCTGNQCSEELKIVQFSLLWLTNPASDQLVHRIHNGPLSPVNRSRGTNGTGLRAGRRDCFCSAKPYAHSLDYRVWIRFRNSFLSIRNPADIPGISVGLTVEPLISTTQRLLHHDLQ